MTLLRPPPTSGPYARDFEAYYAAGAVWNAGGDPYSRAVWRVERTIGGVDPPATSCCPTSARPPRCRCSARWRACRSRWRCGCGAGCWPAALGALLLAALALAGCREVRALLAGLALVLVSGPAISDLALGQVALLSAAGIACALLAYERRNPAGAALATLLAGLQPNLALALIARVVRDRAALLAASVGGLAFAALTLAAGGGPAGLRAYLQRLGEHGRAERFVTIQHTPAAHRLGAGRLARRGGRARHGRRAAGADGAGRRHGAGPARPARRRAARRWPRCRWRCRSSTSTTSCWSWYRCWCWRSALAARRAPGPAVGAVLVLVDWLGIAQRPAGGVQLVALGLALGGAFVALGGGPLRRAELAPLLALAALALVALPLARAHPAPTWPDALPAAYRAPAAAGASAVWAGEQRAAGLTAREPAWGLLRAVPLAGCVAAGRRAGAEPPPAGVTARCRRS